jgi:hypothetical protein
LTEGVRFFARGATHLSGLGDHLRYLAPLLLSGGLLAYEWATRKWEHGLAVGSLPVPARGAAYVAVLLAVLLFGELGGREAIYVQF